MGKIEGGSDTGAGKKSEGHLNLRFLLDIQMEILSRLLAVGYMDLEFGKQS